MDTSETYIKMRREAKVDLGQGIPIESPCNYIGNDVWVDSKGDWYVATGDEVFQLERQAQLQAMVLDKIDCPSQSAFAIIINLGYRFSELAKVTTEYDYWIQFTSMEQLWLAFCMSEKYNKVWEGEQWIVRQ